jgi:anti-sigma regulatory factor (Ser/Thr protein kinase)
VETSGTAPAGRAAQYRLGDLARLRQLVTSAAGAAGLSPDRVAQFTVAVNEVVTNAIQHATGVALVAIERARDRLVVQVADEGPGIPTSVAAQPSAPAPDALGGRGLWLVRAFCDQVDIRTGSAGTRVRLVMLLATPDGAARRDDRA